MTKDKMDRLDWLRKTLEDADVDLMREMLKVFAEELMGAQADAMCGAAYGERSDERVNRRNGYREREFDTRVGTIPLSVPKLREGSYFPDWLLENRRRAERALVAVIAECYVRGVSTRRVDGLVKTLGIEGISSSQVSRMSKTLDEQVEAFRTRPLDAGCHPYLWIDALAIRVREGGRVVKVACVVATTVNGEGRREIVGLDTFTEESGAAWTAFLRGLVARGLSGVRLVVSDSHKGLVAAIGATLPGAAWQRCRTHFMRNVLCRVPKSAQPFVATLIRTIFAQPDAHEVRAQLSRVVEQLEARFPDVAAMLEEAAPDITAFATFPTAHWRQIWSNNPQERLNREIRRRSDVVGIFPNRASVIRLTGAVLAEQHDEWQVARRYMSAETIAVAMRPALEVLETEEGVTPALMAG
ncbi:MAG: IS256 family transposase [Coriobacteriia bacterium]